MITYANLRAEMARIGLNNHQAAKKLRISERSFRNKINAITAFSLPEAETIKKTYFPELTIEELFKNDTQESEVPA